MPNPIVIRYPAAHNGNGISLPNGVGTTEAARNISPLSKGNQTALPRGDRSAIHDISASPRLLCYGFSLVSSAVCTVSSSVFFRQGVILGSEANAEDFADAIGLDLDQTTIDRLNNRISEMSSNYHFYIGSGGLIVSEWKLFGSIAISALFTLITLIISASHFDSICFPDAHRKFFRDGSKGERNLIFALIVLSVFDLHICTSKYSVGESQANVFFSTWTNFISCVANYEIWRTSAGMRPSFQNILFDHRLNSMTRHWFILSIFATISAMSTIDFFVNNNFLNERPDLQCLSVGWANKWIWMSVGSLILTWGVYYTQRITKNHILALRIIEMVVALGIVAGYGLVVANFTGGRLDQVTCPSNLYFGLWATFFTGIWTCSALIQNFGRQSGNKMIQNDSNA